MANNKTNVEVVLGFKANTDQAQKAIRELNNSLNKIQSMNMDSLGLNTELRQAADAAKLLQQNLQAATNVDTGRINIAQFSQGLRNANTSITQLGEKLAGAGATGQQAFLNLSRSIAQMDVPLKQTNAALSNMLTTLKNTVKWELSSNLVHGIEGAFSSAISYAKNLNSSLTDIRIVSGQTVDQMAKFAVEANNAAKALGTTTKSYADAALIYYQQGDSAELAAKKAEITLKATNAAFSATAEEMSQLLTATWNSYQAGTDELEHMVDVMANLGAHTATSLEEIATALQKVAATANTVGVSMEQMSAMISTVSSATRLAPTVVGTAMNTIMSRMGGLKLGETLEDGVDLNKYSAALKKVGVDVLDATGNLRDMGAVVEELGKKWQTLSKGQQSAVAQTIGGTRQYTTMMALFSNWDKYQENLGLAQNADGALNKMQETYMESWEAASKRMKASLETIYSDLINDQGMIKLLNNLTKVIDQVENLIKSFGGLPGILTQVGLIATQVFSNNLAANIIKAGTSIKTFVGSFKGLGFDNQVTLFTGKAGQSKVGSAINQGLTTGSHMAQALGMTTQQRQFQQTINETTTALQDNYSGGKDIYAIQAESAQILLEKKQQLIAIESTLTEEQKRQYQVAIANLEAQNKELDKVTQDYKEQEQIVKENKRDNFTSLQARETAGARAGIMTQGDFTQALQDKIATLTSLNVFSNENFIDTKTPVTNISELIDKFVEYNGTLQKTQTLQEAVKNTLRAAESGDKIGYLEEVKQLSSIFESGNFKGTEFEKIGEQIKELANTSPEQAVETLNKLQTALSSLNDDGTVNIQLISQALKELGYNDDEIKALVSDTEKLHDLAMRMRQTKQGIDEFGQSFQISFSNIQKSVSQGITAFAGAVRTFSAWSNVTANWDSASLVSKLTSVANAAQSTFTTVASLAKMGSAFGPYGAIAGAVIGIGVAVAGNISGKKEADQKKLEEEYAKNVQELNKLKNESEEKSAKTLLNTYSELYSTYKETEEVTQELLESAYNLADAYDIQGAAIKLLKGDIEGFNDSLEDSIDLQEELTKVKAATNQAETTLISGVTTKNYSFSDLLAPITETKGKTTGISGHYDLAKLLATAPKDSGGSIQLREKLYSLIAQNDNAKDILSPYDIETVGDAYRFEILDLEQAEWQKIIDAIGVPGERQLRDFLQNNKFAVNTEANNGQFFTALQNSWVNPVENNPDAWSYNSYKILDLANSYGFNTGKLDLQSLKDQPNKLAEMIINLNDFYTEVQAVLQDTTNEDDKIAYETILKSLSDLHGDTDLLDAAKTYLEKYQQEQLLSSDIIPKLSTLNGSSSIAEINDLYTYIETFLDEHNEDFSELAKFNGDQTSEAYKKARSKIAKQILSDYSAIDQSADLLETIRMAFSGEQLEQILTFLSQDENKNIKTFADFQPYMAGILNTFAMGGNLADSEYFTNYQAQLKSSQAYDEYKSTYDQMTEARSKNLKKTKITEEDYQTIYDAFKDAENASGQKFDWNTFLSNKDYNSRNTYLKQFEEYQLQQSKIEAQNELTKATENQRLIESSIAGYSEETMKNAAKYVTAFMSSGYYSKDLTGEEKLNAFRSFGTQKTEHRGGQTFTVFTDEYNDFIKNFGSLEHYEEVLDLFDQYEVAEGETERLTILTQILEALGNTADTTADKYSRLSTILSGDLSDSENIQEVAKMLGITDYTQWNQKSSTERANIMLDYLNNLENMPKLKDNASPEEIADYNNALKERAALLEQINEILNASSVQQAEKASAAISGLSSELSNITSGKGLSAKTKTLLEAANIKYDVKSMADARKALGELNDQLQQSNDALVANTKEVYHWDISKVSEKGLEILEARAAKNDAEAIAILAAYNEWVSNGDTIIDNAAHIMQTYTEEMSIAADDLAKKIENLQKIADKAKEKANILAGAVSTGQLSAEQRALFSEEELSGWDSGDIAKRGQIAGQALLNSFQAQAAVQVEQQKIINQAIQSGHNIGTKGGWRAQFNFDEHIKKNSKLSDDVKNAIQDAYNSLESSQQQGTLAKVWQNIIEKLQETAKEGDKTFDQLKAQAIDAGVDIAKQIQQQQQELTEKVISIWQNAFKAIADAEIALLNGKSIGDSLDADAIKNLILNASGDLTKEELFAALNSKTREGAKDVLRLGEYKDSQINQTGNTRFLKYDDNGLYEDTSYQEFIKKAEETLDQEARDFYTSLSEETQKQYAENVDEYVKQYVTEGLNGLTKEVYQEAKATAEATEYSYTVQQPKQQKQEIFDAYSEKYSNAQDIMSTLISGGRDSLNPAQWSELTELLGEDQETLENLSNDELVDRLRNKTDELAKDVDTARNALEQFTTALDKGAQYLGQNENGEDEFYYQGKTQTMSDELGGGTKDYGYQKEGEEWLNKELESAQASWLSEVDTDLDKLDSLQMALADSTTKASDLSEKWLSLAETLDFTNPQIAEAYEHLQMAQSGEYDMQTATDELTDAILRQGDVLIQDNATLRAYLKKWQENYLVTDKNRKGYNAAALAELRFGKGAKQIMHTLGEANKTYHLSARRMADLRKEAQKSGKTMSDFADSVEGLTDEDKKMIKSFDNMYDKFDKLNSEHGLEGFTEDFADDLLSIQDSGEAFDAFTDQILNGLAKNGSDIEFEAANLKDRLGSAIDTLSSETCAKLQAEGVDIQTAFDAVVDALVTANGKAVDVDWGTLVGIGGANMDQLIELALAIIHALNEAQGTGLFDVSELIAAAQTALSAFQDVQGKYGHGSGGGSHNDKETPKKGGGGGGKDKKKKVEGYKQPDEEKERYHEIRDQLDAQSKVLDKIDKLKERAFGKHHLDQINAEIKALEKDLQLQKQYFREASQYYEANLKKLIDAGATFNEDGTINYDEFMDNIIRQYNNAVDAFNDSEQTALDQMKLEEAKARFDELKKLLEDYEEDLDLVQEIQTQIIEEQNKISAAALEGIQYKIELKLDLSERDIAMLDYFNDKWEELLDRQDDRMLNMTKQVAIYESNLTALGAAMKELQGKYNEGVLTEADYAEGMKDINDKILEQLENIQDVKDSLKELYGETLELASDKIEKYTSIMEHSRDVMESYIEMSELMGRGADYAGLEQVYQMQYDSSVTNVEAAKMYLDTLKASRDEIERQVAENGWTEVLQQQWYDVTNAITEGENELLNQTKQALEDAQSMFENTMQKIIASFDDVLFNMKNGLSQLEDDYNYYTEEQARYLSTSKELYEVAKLNREIDESISDATTKTSKERLKALQEVINKQSESTRLTEYDVQMMELQYKHALALQELEEAKNAKSTVRLTRDENGNYGYQYTANDDDINDARQKVDDALQAINELAANRAAEIEQQVIDTERQYRDELLAIAQDTNLTLEERQAKMEELTRRHNETLQFYNEQYTNATNALLTNQEYVYQRYGVSIMENTGMVQDQMNATVKAMIDKTSDYASYLEEQMSPGGQIYEALAKYKHDMGIVEGASGLTWSDMTGSIDQYKDANEKAKESIADVNTVLQQTLEGVADVTEQWDQHVAALEKVIKMYEKLGQSAADAVGKLANVEGMFGTSLGGTSGVNAEAGKVAGQTPKQYQYTWGPINGLQGVWSGYDSESAARQGAIDDIEAAFKNTIVEGEDNEETERNRKRAEEFIKKAKETINVVSYLSGGLADYTGPAWLDGSKSAPELVLNSQDTANLLSAVDIVRAIDEETLRQISSMMKYSAISAVMGAGNGLSAGGVNPFAQTLDQNVHIEADFPNVTDKNEIIEAFDDLVNLASQYASRG